MEKSMQKNDPPEAFGVFKPVGHVVMSFKSDSDLEAAMQALLARGFAASEFVRYSPAQMTAQVDLDLQHATPLASLGQELNLVKAHRALAERGYGFLVVHAPDDLLRQRVAAIARLTHARTARSYGRFIIEELIDPAPGENQVFESPARGLDVPTPTRAR